MKFDHIETYVSLLTFITLIVHFILFAGICECTLGWTGDDCSIEEDTPPVIITDNDANHITCNGNCNTITIIGNNFVDNGNLVCKFTNIQVCVILVWLHSNRCLSYSDRYLFKGKHMCYFKADSDIDYCFKTFDLILQIDAKTSWTAGSTEVVVAATFISITQIVCTLPQETGSYTVVISNDKTVFTTTTVIVLVYDTKCYRCDFTGSCSTRVCNLDC